MITVKKALSLIKQTKAKLKTESIEPEFSLGRVLAENVKSRADNPPFDMSAMDGYAVSDNPTNGIYKLVGKTFAGKPTKKKLFKGEAIRVFTGSKLPQNTKTVIIQENVNIIDKTLISHNPRNFKSGNYIRKKGIDFKNNKIIILKNKHLTARDIALLIAANTKRIKVYKKPEITLLASGDELILNGKSKKQGTVFASSLFMINSLINLSFSLCAKKKIVKDNKEIIKKELLKASNSDVIITTGGVSVGKKDLIRSSLIELGFKERFWKILMMPGKPLLFGTLRGTPVFSLPGNPVSSYVCFHVFVIPYLYKLLNLKKVLNIKVAYLKSSLNTFSIREAYLRGFYYKSKNKKHVKPLANQDSSLLKTLSDSNCLIKIPSNTKLIPKGTKVEILLLPYLH